MKDKLNNLIAVGDMVICLHKKTPHNHGHASNRNYHRFSVKKYNLCKSRRNETRRIYKPQSKYNCKI